MSLQETQAVKEWDTAVSRMYVRNLDLILQGLYFFLTGGHDRNEEGEEEEEVHMNNMNTQHNGTDKGTKPKTKTSKYENVPELDLCLSWRALIVS